MGWLSKITGKDAAREARYEQQQALKASRKAQEEALNNIRGHADKQHAMSNIYLSNYKNRAKDLANRYSDNIINAQLNAYRRQGSGLLGAKEDYRNTLQEAAGNYATGVTDATAQANQALSSAAGQYKEAMTPFAESGKIAELSLAEMIEDPMKWLQKDPGYQARMDQGMKAVQNSAAARGMLDSGKTLKDLQRFGQDYASQEFDKAFNRTLSLADRGRQVTQEIAAMDFDVANINSTRNLEAANKVAGLQMDVTSDIARMSESIDEALAAGEIEKADKMSEIMLKTQGILQGIESAYFNMKNQISDRWFGTQIRTEEQAAGLASDSAIAQGQIAQQYAQNRAAGMSNFLGGVTSLFGLF